MDSLGEDERNAYVSDFRGFVSYVREKGFQTYADKVYLFQLSAHDRIAAFTPPDLRQQAAFVSVGNVYMIAPCTPSRPVPKRCVFFCRLHAV